MTLKNFFVGRTIVFIALLVIGFSIFAYKEYFSAKAPLDSTAIESNYKLISRDVYSFQIPNDWMVTEPRDVDGCRWDGAVNDGSDGHRQNGEIGIYQKSCFDLSKSLGKKEVAEKDGFYIVAYYDTETGTTAEEIAETKLAHAKLVSTFSKNKN